MDLDESISPSERRRAEVHRERAEAIEGLRDRISTLEAREPELKQEIAEFEKSQRATIAELEKNQRTTIAELEKAVRAKPDNVEELEKELERTRTELAEELERTRTELASELGGMRAEFAAIGPALIEARCTLGMKMSDFAIEEHEGHEEAIEYLQPLLAVLRTAYSRALSEAKRNADEVDEKLKELEAEHRDTAEETLPLVEDRFHRLIEAEAIGSTMAQAKARVARHQLALVDPDAEDPNEGLVREHELDTARDELDAARAKVAALQEERRAAVYHYSHPTVEKSKNLGKQFAKRLHRHR